MVILDMTVSLDGFVAGPDDEFDRIHEWILGERTEEASLLHAELFDGAGAVVMGRRTFDLGDERNGGWLENPPFRVPVFVVSHGAPERARRVESPFSFVDGATAAVERARAAAGERNVVVIGGADTARQCLAAGLLDELNLHLAHVFLGRGVRLFHPFDGGPVETERVALVETPGVTHLRLRVVR